MTDTLEDDRGPYIALASGRRYYFLRPEADEIFLEDIIAGLHQLRWTGQAHAVGSILTHSYRVWLVSSFLGGSRQECATALFHDAHEAYLGDVSRPLKVAMTVLSHDGLSPYRHLESLGMLTVAKRFDLIYPHPPVVHEADEAVLCWEVKLWGRDPVDFGLSKPLPEISRLLEGTLVYPWHTEQAMKQWAQENGIAA